MTGLDPTLLLAGDFVLLRMALVDDLGGDIEAAIVLQRIAWRCEREGQWVASHADIQGDTRLSERKVKRALAVLRERGYITSERASSWDPTQAWSVVLNRPSPDGRNVRHVEDVLPLTLPDETSVTSSQHPETTTNTKDSPVAPRRAPAPVVAEGFDQFWAAYPRNTDKGKARTAWTKAVAKADAQTIIRAAQEFAAWNTQRRTETRFIPHPTTWLNAERWEDTLPAMTPAESRALSMAGDVHQDGSWANTSDGGWDAYR